MHQPLVRYQDAHKTTLNQGRRPLYHLCLCILQLLKELIGYTITLIEVATCGTGVTATGNVADSLTETQVWMVWSLLGCLASFVRIELEGRPDGGKEVVKQVIIKRLLPEWSRMSLMSYSYPLLLIGTIIPFCALVCSCGAIFRCGGAIGLYSIIKCFCCFTFTPIMGCLHSHLVWTYMEKSIS